MRRVFRLHVKGTTNPRVVFNLPKPGLRHLRRGEMKEIFFSGLHNGQFSQLHCETDNMTEVKRRKGTEIGLRRGYNEESMNTGLFFMFISIHSWYVIVHHFCGQIQ